MCLISDDAAMSCPGDLVHQLGDEDVGDSALKHLGDNKQRRNLCDTTNSGGNFFNLEFFNVILIHYFPS